VLAIGEARKRLPRVQREQQDKYREELEARYGKAVVKAAKTLREALPVDAIDKIIVTRGGEA